MIDQQLSQTEITEVVSSLSKLHPGLLPFEIFHAITRLVATPIIELVPVRLNKKGIPEILLLRRDANDPVWPNQLHTPGTVVRGSDVPGSFQDAFNRIAGELGGVQLSHPTFVKSILHHSGRGMEVSQIYWAEIYDTETTLVGNFFAADTLPDETVQSQLDFIPDVVRHYIQTRHIN